MNLKYIMLSKDATDWMIPFIFHAGESTTFETENRAIIAKLWHWRNEQTAEEYRKKMGIMVLFYILIMGLVTELYALVKTHRSVH